MKNLNFYVSIFNGNISAAVTPEKDLGAADDDVRESTLGEERVIAFISRKGPAAEALRALATVSWDPDESIDNELGDIVTDAFKEGMEYARRLAEEKKV